MTASATPIAISPDLSVVNRFMVSLIQQSVAQVQCRLAQSRIRAKAARSLQAFD
jgi:hypothetical protein